MEAAVFFGDITEEELKLRLYIKINELLNSNQDKKSENSSEENYIEKLLMDLANKYVASKGLSEEEITDELKKITEICSNLETTYVYQEETITLDESACSGRDSNRLDTSNVFNDTFETMQKLLKGDIDFDHESENLEDTEEIINQKNEESESLLEEKFAFTEENEVNKEQKVTTEEEKYTLKGENDVNQEENENNLEEKVTFEEEHVEHVDLSEMVENMDCQFSKIYESDGFKTPIPKTQNFLEATKKRYKTQTPVGKQLFKDVISPVAYYIKNSGTYTPQKHLKTNNQNSKYVQLPENIFINTVKINQFPNAKNLVLPNINYTPAANQIVCHETQIHLPKNIKKLVGIPSVLIHDKRSENKENEEISFYIKKPANII